MSSTSVKILFYFYGVATSCCVGFTSVLISLRNLYPLNARLIKVMLLLYISVLRLFFVLLILCICLLSFVGE